MNGQIRNTATGRMRGVALTERHHAGTAPAALRADDQQPGRDQENKVGPLAA